MKTIKNTKLNKKNKKDILLHNNLKSNKFVSRKILNKLILKGGNYVRQYNVSSDHTKKTQKKNGGLKRTMTALKQNGGFFVFDYITLKYKVSQFKSFIKKYRKEEIEIKKHLDAYKGKATILEGFKSTKFSNIQKYIIHYRYKEIYEFIFDNIDDEKDIKTLGIYDKLRDAKLKLIGIENSLKTNDKEQKKELPNLIKQTKKFKKNSKDISKLINYFETTLRGYYDKIDTIKKKYIAYKGDQSKLNSEAKTAINKYLKLKPDIDYILSFTDKNIADMITLKNDISTILDKGATSSEQFKKMSKDTYEEDLEKWKDNYSRIYENLDITDDIDKLIGTYNSAINILQNIKNQFAIMRIGSTGNDTKINFITSIISTLQRHMDGILIPERTYIRQFKVALVLNNKTFNDTTNTSLNYLEGGINKIIEDNIKIFKNITTTIEGFTSTKQVGGAGRTHKITKTDLNIKDTITYEKFMEIDITVVDDENKLKRFIKYLDDIFKDSTDTDTNTNKFFGLPIQRQYNLIKVLFNVWLFMIYFRDLQDGVEFFTGKSFTDCILPFIKIIFVYELLNYKGILKDETLDNDNYKTLKDTLKKIFKEMENYSLNFNNIIDKQMKTELTGGKKQLKDLDKPEKIKTLIGQLQKNTKKMADYTISNIDIKSNPALTLKQELEKEFITSYIDIADKQKFNGVYQKQIGAGGGNLQAEIYNWKTPDSSNNFEKAIALSILHIREKDTGTTTDQKTKIKEYIGKIESKNTLIIDFNLICPPNPAVVPPGTVSGTLPGTLPGAPATGAPAPATVGASGIGALIGTQQLQQLQQLQQKQQSGQLLTQPEQQQLQQLQQQQLLLLQQQQLGQAGQQLPGQAIFSNVLAIASANPNYQHNVENIKRYLSNFEKVMKQLTPEQDTNKIPEPYSRIIKKLNIINECINNLKLIEPKFKIKEESYKKVDLSYNWLQDFVKDSTPFTATNNIVKIQEAVKHKAPQGFSDKVSEFTEANFYEIIVKQDKAEKSIFDKLKSTDNQDKFKAYFNNLFNNNNTNACLFAGKTRPIELLKYPEISTFLAQTAADTGKCPKPKKEGTR